jgi:hypothetical protein
VGDVSVVVVVVELVTGAVTTAGAGTATTAGAGAGTVSTIGAGVVAVSSTVLWYEKHPTTSPQVAITAGNIAIRLIDRILVASIGYMRLIAARNRPLGMDRICLDTGW